MSKNGNKVGSAVNGTRATVSADCRVLLPVAWSNLMVRDKRHVGDGGAITLSRADGKIGISLTADGKPSRMILCFPLNPRQCHFGLTSSSIEDAARRIKTPGWGEESVERFGLCMGCFQGTFHGVKLVCSAFSDVLPGDPLFDQGIEAARLIVNDVAPLEAKARKGKVAPTFIDAAD